MGMPGVSIGRSFRGDQQMDYHDLQMFDLEMAAEDRFNQANLALKGHTAASKDVERWSNTLENIRQLKAAIGRMQPNGCASRATRPE
jgi:hypothetical protein